MDGSTFFVITIPLRAENKRIEAMRRTIFSSLLIICLVASINLKAQGRIDTIYYDKDWVVVPHKAFAEYYRIAYYPSDSSQKKLLRDYYITGELQAEGGFIHLGENEDSTTVFDGLLINYYKNGQKESERTFSNGKMNGEWIEYNNDGLISFKANWKNNLLDGLYTKFFENGQFIQFEYVDGTPKTPYYYYGNAEGQMMKINFVDNSPYWESPSREDRKTIYRQGTPWQYYIANGLTVAMTVTEIKDYGRWFKVDLIVSNNSPVPITFDAENVSGTIMAYDNTLQEARTWTCEEYIKRVNNRQAWASVAVGLAEGMATANAGYTNTTTYSTTNYNGSSFGYGSVSAYGNGGYGYGSYSGHSSYSGYSNTYSRSTTYDAAAAYQARVLSAQRMSDFSNAQWQERQAKNAGYIKKNTINPEETITGYVLIERKRSKELYVTININGAEYNYAWNTQH